MIFLEHELKTVSFTQNAPYLCSAHSTHAKSGSETFRRTSHTSFCSETFRRTSHTSFQVPLKQQQRFGESSPVSLTGQRGSTGHQRQIYTQNNKTGNLLESKFFSSSSSSSLPPPSSSSLLPGIGQRHRILPSGLPT